MTTTTAEATDTTYVGPDLNPDRSRNVPAIADPAAVPAQFDEFNLAVRRMLGIEDASDGEVELFFHVCHKSGLDPFNKEVYMIGRNTEVASWEPVNPEEPDGQKRKVKRWVTKYTIQTGINGFRKRAREIARLKGIDYTQEDPQWCGEDGVWKEVWTDKAPPVAAKFILYRDGERYAFIAHYDEYVQTVNVDGSYRPNSMWAKMPRNMLRKCAEAGAIQAAFPDELGALLLEDAAQNEPIVLEQDEDGTFAPPAEKPAKRRGGKGVGGLADRAAAAKEEPEIVEQEAEPGRSGGNDASEGAATESANRPPDSRDQDTTPKSGMRKAVEKRLFKLLGDAKVTERDHRIDIYNAVLQRDDVTSTNDLDDVEVTKIGDQLYGWQRDGVLDVEIAEILHAATLKADNASEGAGQ
jgi:phage recombination protein Bet